MLFISSDIAGFLCKYILLLQTSDGLVRLWSMTHSSIRPRLASCWPSHLSGWPALWQAHILSGISHSFQRKFASSTFMKDQCQCFFFFFLASAVCIIWITAISESIPKRRLFVKRTGLISSQVLGSGEWQDMAVEWPSAVRSLKPLLVKNWAYIRSCSFGWVRWFLDLRVGQHFILWRRNGLGSE